MSEPLPNATDLRSDAARQIRATEASCDRFEAAWRDGDTPLLERYLTANNGAALPGLLHDCLAIELGYRRQRGEQPEIADYLTRFPADASVVRSVFAEEATKSRNGSAVSAP